MEEEQYVRVMREFASLVYDLYIQKRGDLPDDGLYTDVDTLRGMTEEIYSSVRDFMIWVVDTYFNAVDCEIGNMSEGDVIMPDLIISGLTEEFVDNLIEDFRRENFK